MKVKPLNALCAFVALSAVAWHAQVRAEPVVQQAGNVSFVTGGVGLEERATLSQQTADFNLKVVNAVPGRPFVADVNIAVVDSRGQEVLRTTSDGPWLLAKLPPGRYTIKASDGSRTQTRNVQLGQSQREVMLRWPEQADTSASGSGSVGSSSNSAPISVPRYL